VGVLICGLWLGALSTRGLGTRCAHSVGSPNGLWTHMHHKDSVDLCTCKAAIRDGTDDLEAVSISCGGATVALQRRSSTASRQCRTVVTLSLAVA
jgi:hypothetical protein